MKWIPIHTTEDIQRVHRLAKEIWHQHYDSLIGCEMVNYMLDTVHGPDAIKRHIESGTVYEIVQNENTTDSGYIAYGRQDDLCFISKFYIIASARRQGLGTASMQRIRGYADKHKLSPLQLSVNRGNEGSIKMYEKQGFRTTKDILIDIGNGYHMDDHVMECIV